MCCRAADVATLPIASAVDHPAEHYLTAWCPRCNHPVDCVCPDCRHNVEASGVSSDGPGASTLTRSDFLQRLFDLILNARNSKFTTGCCLIALGHPISDGISMADYARQWGVRRATVSKQCLLICAALGLPPSRLMRDEVTRAKFRLSNRRPRKF